MSKSLLVLGGGGFVGKAVCREGVRRGWRVASLNRRGAPTNARQDALLSKVEWKSGSALELNDYPNMLENVDYVVHSIGTLFEAKPLIAGSTVHPNSYRALIRDTAAVALEASIQTNVKGFAYISSTSFGPLGRALLPRYMEMKAEAEGLIKAEETPMRRVIVRPGFMYGAERWPTIPMAFGIQLASLFTAGLLPKALAVDTVARAILNALSVESGSATCSILEVADIDQIGQL